LDQRFDGSVAEFARDLIVVLGDNNPNAAGIGAIDLLFGRLNFLMHKSFFRWDWGLAKFPWSQMVIVQHSGLPVDTLDSIRPRYLK
jgi:hypothetical protein